MHKVTFLNQNCHHLSGDAVSSRNLPEDKLKTINSKEITNPNQLAIQNSKVMLVNLETAGQAKSVVCPNCEAYGKNLVYLENFLKNCLPKNNCEHCVASLSYIQYMMKICSEYEMTSQVPNAGYKTNDVLVKTKSAVLDKKKEPKPKVSIKPKSTLKKKTRKTKVTLPGMPALNESIEKHKTTSAPKKFTKKSSTKKKVKKSADKQK